MSSTRHIEEAFTGQSLVKVFGRRQEVEEAFAERNVSLFESSSGRSSSRASSCRR